MSLEGLAFLIDYEAIKRDRNLWDVFVVTAKALGHRVYVSVQSEDDVSEAVGTCPLGSYVYRCPGEPLEDLLASGVEIDTYVQEHPCGD